MAGLTVPTHTHNLDGKRLDQSYDLQRRPEWPITLIIVKNNPQRYILKKFSLQLKGFVQKGRFFLLVSSFDEVCCPAAVLQNFFLKVYGLATEEYEKYLDLLE